MKYHTIKCKSCDEIIERAICVKEGAGICFDCKMTQLKDYQCQYRERAIMKDKVQPQEDQSIQE